MAESSQNKVARVRRPMVILKYEVETNGAMVSKELPFIVGVLSDLSGDPTGDIRPLKDRKFTQIDVNTFDEVMAKMKAGLKLRVRNTLADDGSEMPVNLSFGGLEDFLPERIARQIEPLRKLLDTRQQLTELINKIDRSDALGNLLEKIMTDDQLKKKLREELKLG
jgi:type VI secretion system protein ImpB